jgi:hypothetical protein
LFCSAVKIIPIDIQTKIITKRVSNYIDLREQLKVIRPGPEHYNLEKSLKNDIFIHSNERENKYSYSVKKDNTIKNRMSNNFYLRNNEFPITNDTSRQLETEEPYVSKEVQVEINNNISGLSISEKNQKQDQKGFHQTPRTCRRMRIKLGGPQKKSILASFGKGRLGNKLSSFASCYAMAKDFGLYNYISQNQYVLLRRVFNFPKSKEEREDSIYYVWRKGK